MNLIIINDLPKNARKKTILKIPIRASKPESYIEAEHLLAEGYKLAVDIQDRRSLQAVPTQATLVILDSIFMGLIDDDIASLDKKKLLIKNIENYESFEEFKEQ